MARNVVVCSLPVILGVAVYLHFSSIELETFESKRVRTLEWQYHPGFADKIASGRVPAAFSHSPFLNWPAANWTPMYLAENVPFVLMKKSRKSFFKYFSKNMPLSTIIEVNKEYTEVIKSGREFVKGITMATDGNYYYASGPIDQLELPPDVVNPDSLIVHDPGIQNSTVAVNFWIGSKSVTAHMHYDTSHNFHVVVHGRKKFKLMPPSAHQYLRLYPSIHPYYRQTQVNISHDGPNLSSWRSLLQEVVLQAGDTLYIPPYWFHEVTSENVTISLNVWSPSKEHSAMETIYNLPLPLDTNWLRGQLLAAATVYIDSLLHQLDLEFYLGIIPQEFLHCVYHQRYAEVFVKPECAGNFCSTLPLPNQTSSEDLSSHAGEVAKIIIEGHAMDQQILGINVANFIEHLVSHVLGNKELSQIPCYFYSCLKVIL